MEVVLVMSKNWLGWMALGLTTPMIAVAQAAPTLILEGINPELVGGVNALRILLLFIAPINGPNSCNNQVKQGWERKALENYEAFSEEVRKRVTEKILSESRRLEGLYTFEDVLATPIVRYFESLKKRISRFADAGLSRYSPKRFFVILMG